VTSSPTSVRPDEVAGLADDGSAPVDPPGRRRPTRRSGPVGMAGSRRAWMLLAPSLVVVALLLWWPLGTVVSISLQDFGIRELRTGELAWVGLENYRNLLADDLLWRYAFPNTVVFALVTVVLTLVLGTLVALLLARLGSWARGIVTTIIMVAWAMPAVTGTYVWRLAFDGDSGVLTGVLASVGLFDPATDNLFTDRLWFFSIATLNVVHHGFPFVAITVLAGLMTLPKEVQEAAVMDGANAWRRFWSITMPMLRPVFAVVTILSTIWNFKVFTQIYLMPAGDGSNREVLNLGTWSYSYAFGQGGYGPGAAIAVLLTALLLVITLVYLRVLFREDEL